MRGKGLAAMVAVLVLVFACAPPTHIPVDASPSPSPTPTSQLQATTAGFHGGEIGVSYDPVPLMATGGLAPYKWTVSAGTLPPGLTLGNDGTVSGTPTAGGKFVFTAQLADSGNSTATIDGAIFIADRIAANLISACAKYCNVELGCVDVCGNFGSLSGGVSPFQYSLAQGPLPAGTSLDGLSLKGTFRGLSGYLQFTVQVTDSLGASTTISPTFWMYEHISVASGGCYGNFTTGCSVRLPISGGVPGSQVTVRLLAEAQNPTPNPPPYQGTCWQLASTAPPSGYSLSVSGGYVNVAIPKGIINGYGAVWTIAVSDQELCSVQTYCTSPDAKVTIGVQCG